MFSDIMHGIMITMSPDCLLALCIGAMFGTVVGALPGLGTAVAITICIPFTLQMGNASAIALLLGVYATSIYGGSISAVLLNTPGTPQSACTGFEGYAMAKAGYLKGDNGNFRPEDNISRAELVTVLNRIADIEDGSGVRIADVDKNHWAYGYICAAVYRSN